VNREKENIQGPSGKILEIYYPVVVKVGRLD
jgi:hypothetical protein